jgi:hypothetical protein
MWLQPPAFACYSILWDDHLKKAAHPFTTRVPMPNHLMTEFLPLTGCGSRLP